MTNKPPPDWLSGWDYEAWARTAREYAAERAPTAPLSPSDYAGPIPVGRCPTCGGDPCNLPSFCAMCRAVDRRNAQIPTIKPRTPERRSSPATVEALMYSLRERGVGALDEPDTRRCVSELDDAQAIEVAARLLKPKLAINKVWTADDVRLFVQCCGSLR
jgi:hypothetical protein